MADRGHQPEHRHADDREYQADDKSGVVTSRHIIRKLPESAKRGTTSQLDIGRTKN